MIRFRLSFGGRVWTLMHSVRWYMISVFPNTGDVTLVTWLRWCLQDFSTGRLIFISIIISKHFIVKYFVCKYLVSCAFYSLILASTVISLLNESITTFDEKWWYSDSIVYIHQLAFQCKAKHPPLYVFILFLYINVSSWIF